MEIGEAPGTGPDTYPGSVTFLSLSFPTSPHAIRDKSLLAPTWSNWPQYLVKNLKNQS